MALPEASKKKATFCSAEKESRESHCKTACRSSSQFSAQAARCIFVKSPFQGAAPFHIMFRFAIALLIAVASSRRSGEIELTRERAECQAVDSTKAYFDGLRDKYQIQECTKRDVCLLMRQLDAYFYTRARQGKLVSYDSPPQRSWVYDGRCEKNARSIKLAPITKLPACKAAVRAKGIQKVKVVNSTTLPTGCSIKTQRTSKAYLNKLETKVEAGLTYEDTKHWSQTNKKEIAQYCEVDHSLSEAAASYYSPYKLKQSMKETGFLLRALLY